MTVVPHLTPLRLCAPRVGMRAFWRMARPRNEFVGPVICGLLNRITHVFPPLTPPSIPASSVRHGPRLWRRWKSRWGPEWFPPPMATFAFYRVTNYPLTVVRADPCVATCSGLHTSFTFLLRSSRYRCWRPQAAAARARTDRGWRLLASSRSGIRGRVHKVIAPPSFQIPERQTGCGSPRHG